MTPALEEELVIQGMKEKWDRQYLLDRIMALRSLGFKVDDRAVEVELKRYKLLQEYNSQDNNPKKIKKRREEELKRIGEEEIERLRIRDPRIDSAKLKAWDKEYHLCNNCDRYQGRIAAIYYTQLVRLTDRLKSEFKTLYLTYCFGCGKKKIRDYYSQTI